MIVSGSIILSVFDKNRKKFVYIYAQCVCTRKLVCMCKCVNHNKRPQRTKKKEKVFIHDMNTMKYYAKESESGRVNRCLNRTDMQT